MSFTGMRQSFASALSAIEGVHGYAHRPAGPAVGDAWPLLSTLTRDKGTAFVAQWRVRIILPQEEEAASAWLDAHWVALFFALEPLGYVHLATPVMLAAGGGDLYALEITMQAEE